MGTIETHSGKSDQTLRDPYTDSVPFYSPLRYPGGKRRLTATVTSLLEENGLKDINYFEPYAGGASIALALLFEEYASVIHINDLSRPIYAFWSSALNNTTELCRRIERTKVTMREWHRQRAVYVNREKTALDDLGFAAFFLNRTNRSGIVAGGVIGGKRQTGDWALDARFNKEELIKRIQKIGRYKSRIKLYQMDALDFTKEIPSKLSGPAFSFYDPPYIENGQDLYLNDYTVEGHRALAQKIHSLRMPWVVTYDYSAVKYNLYPKHRRIAYGLNYAAQSRYKGKEVMFLSDDLQLPMSWEHAHQIAMSHEHSQFPLYGKMEVMKPHPEMIEEPEAKTRFLKAPGTVLSVPKSSIPNPSKMPPAKKERPPASKG